MYNDEVIQIIGGINDYIGKLDQTPHPMGPDWYRLKDPCLIFVRDDPEKKTMNTIVSKLQGPPGQNNYRKYVDIRIPDTSHMEIRTVDKKGKLYEVYKTELELKEPSKIIVPDFGIASPN